MKSNVKKVFFIATIITSFIFTSCSKDTWLTNLDKAKSKASKQNKNIYLLFSGDDWDNESVAFKQSVTNTEQFNELFGKDYVFVNIDFSQETFKKIDELPEDADKKQTKEVEKIKEEYAEKSKIAQTYAVQNFPTAYILTSEGYVLLELPFNADLVDAASYKQEIESRKSEITAAEDLINKIKISEGVEKVKAIDELCKSEKGNRFIASYRDFISMVPSLDPNNESGLLGDFLVRNAYFEASKEIENNGDPSKPFVDIAENPILTPELKQEAYYVAAYNLAMIGSTDFDKMIDYLQKSYDSNPQGVNVSGISNALEQVKQMKSVYEQMSASGAIAPEGASEATSESKENQN